MEESEEVRGFLSSLIETFGTPRMGPAFTGAISAEPGVLQRLNCQDFDDVGVARRVTVTGLAGGATAEV